MAKRRIISYNRPVSTGTGPPDFDRKLVEPWEWTWVHGENIDYIHIPAPVVYDPSIPWFAQSIVPDDPLEAASLPHDVIYKLQGETGEIIRRWQDATKEWVPVQSVSRSYADKMFRDILRIQKVATWRRTLAYRAVKYGGGWAWREEDDFTLP